MANAFVNAAGDITPRLTDYILPARGGRWLDSRGRRRGDDRAEGRTQPYLSHRNGRHFSIARRFHSSHGRSTSASLVFIAAAASASFRNVVSPSLSASLSMRAFTSV
jgi:hypothetical protein